MDGVLRRIFMFLLGVLLGYFVGFGDARQHQNVVFLRVIHRVENFGERTVGDPSRRMEEATERIGR